MKLDPEVVLVVFLPPLLYGESIFANFRDLDAQAEHLFCPLLASTLVTGVHPQVREARKAIYYTLQ